MRFRRGFRRKPRVQWLAGPGTELNQNAQPTLAAILENPQAIEIAFGTIDGAPTTFEAPLIVDNPLEEQLAGTTLAVWQKFGLNQTNQFGWRLRRIVGDLFISVQQQGQGNNLPGVLLQAGIIVRRVDATGTSPAPPADTTCGAIGNETDPWVWRRNWVLSSNASTNGTTPSNRAINRFPGSTPGYGTKHHIALDQKTARRIGPEERLFLTCTAWELPLNQAGVAGSNTDDHMTVYFCMPYRVLGTVITVAGNRRNASR